ncbi:hypothetical protein EW145_g7219 [Phellinidium pouzarii]|uniref:Uncharacterized protein n=1 Tax=Phellinidium pouzarii TaxID=167371 RepID=A0A4S4KMC8_9AGAM|nr:hypothetical protein EW145_g7219 [Phellinidium pouzarii]
MADSNIASKDFLAHLKSLYPSEPKSHSPTGSTDLQNPWFLVAAVAYSAGNRPEAVPRVYESVIDALDSAAASHGEKLSTTRVLRDAIFKSGMIGGYSRTISALIALYEATPSELRETKLIRQVDNDTVADLVSRGDELFTAMYGETAASVQSLLEAIHPDMAWFSKNIAYGHTYNATHVVSQRDTSYAIVAALIAMDTPRQVAWHLANCRRGGASLEEVRAVRRIAMEVAEACGVKWRDGVPEVVEDK